MSLAPEVELLTALKNALSGAPSHYVASSRGNSPDRSSPDSPSFAPCTPTTIVPSRPILPAIQLPSFPKILDDTIESQIRETLGSAKLARPSTRSSAIAIQLPRDDLALLLAAVERLEGKSSTEESSPPSPTASLLTSPTSSEDDVSSTVTSPSTSKPARRPYRRNPSNSLKRHKCEWPDCSMSFHTTAELVCHTRTHTGERPFGCETCGKRFAQSGGLLRHRRTHSGEKPYLCEVESCGKAFAESGHLTRHMRSHTGEKPFVCDCGKSFTTSYHLARHKIIHNRE